MAGKRKITRQRPARKTRLRKAKAEDEQSSALNNSYFSKEEEKEPLSTHIKPSPKKSPRGRSPKRRKKDAPSIVDDGDSASNDDDKEKSANDDGNENTKSATNNDDENDAGEEEHTNKYEVRQRVLARDEDGILYYGNIRRKLYGINHQETISCLGIFDLAPDQIAGKDSNKKESAGDIQSNNDESEANNNSNQWHYFIHYEGWKTLFDRWVSESDILDITPENLERMKEISNTHKAFQREFKEKTKKKKIQNGGLFLQQWKQRLDALNHRYDEKLRETNANDKVNESKERQRKAAKRRKAAAAKKKNSKSPEEILRDQSKLAIQSCLTTRQASHIQAIPLASGLKRILVEDWENLNNGNFAAENSIDDASDENLNWDMVHVLPAKVTIRDALTLYLMEKGISWDGKPKNANKSNGAKANSTSEDPTEIGSTSKPENETSPATRNDQTTTEPSILSKEMIFTYQESMSEVKDDPDLNSKQDNDDAENGISIQLVKEWTDMAEGIVLYFEQALMARLLYPSEISQILVLEDTILDDKDDSETSNTIPLKADIYGCEHLLRLLASIPRILDQQLQDSRKRKSERKKETSKQQHESKPDEDINQDDAFVEIGSMILAKLQDLSRFLQKNQSALFRSIYRKKSEQEIKRDVKIQKRQERRLKSAAAAATASSQNKVQNSQDQEA